MREEMPGNRRQNYAPCSSNTNAAMKMQRACKCLPEVNVVGDVEALVASHQARNLELQP